MIGKGAFSGKRLDSRYNKKLSNIRTADMASWCITQGKRYSKGALISAF